MKKHYILLSFIVFFLLAHKASASLVITDIMFDPEGSDTNREWVKIQNDGESSVSITGGKSDSAWRFGDGAEGLILHYLSESVNLSTGEYLVIAKDKDIFLSENSFSGKVITTSMSLPNASGTVKIWDGSNPRNVVASKSYTEADGNTNTNTDNNNEESGANQEQNNTNVTTGYIHGTKVKNSDPKVIVYNAEIIADKVGVVGLSLPITSEVTNNKGITFNVGRFVWSFGDGLGRVDDSLKKFEHIYKYPGEYVITLKYYKKDKTDLLASDRWLVKIIASSLYVKSVGGASDPYIELENKSEYEIDLSGWIIKGSTKDFTIPEGTILLPKKIIKISGDITGFSIYDLSKISMVNKDGGEMARYPNRNYSYNNNEYVVGTNQNNKNNLNSKEDEENDTIDLNDSLEASAGSLKNIKINYPIIGFISILLIGVSSIFFVKKLNKNNNNKENLDDFPDNLSVDDIKITE